MDKQTLLDKLSTSPEERTMLARVLDKYQQMERRNIPTATPFLSESEQVVVQQLLAASDIHSGYIWNGGYPEAGRKLLQFLPDWADGDDSAIAYLRAAYRGGEHPTHRDCLGSLMGLGIVREKLGDILVGEDACFVIAAADIVPFLAQNWDSAGRVKLSVTEVSAQDLQVPQQHIRELRDTVMSLRLDAVVATGFAMSRTKAVQLIQSGRVQVNHRDCLKGDRLVDQGDVVTARGFGKFILAEVGGASRKKGAPLS